MKPTLDDLRAERDELLELLDAVALGVGSLTGYERIVLSSRIAALDALIDTVKRTSRHDGQALH
jgi:hypothetical protein